VPPFVIAAGDRARVRALNRVGLERSGVPEASRLALKRAFRVLFAGGLPRAAALESIEGETDSYVRELVGFLRLPPKRQGG
jgi:UDP-N-acetylglucosamine acyltransferase